MTDFDLARRDTVKAMLESPFQATNSLAGGFSERTHIFDIPDLSREEAAVEENP